MTGIAPGTDFDIDGKPAPPRGQKRYTDVQVVGSDYFRTMQIPLLRGRIFSSQEETVMSHVVIVSEALAREFFPGENPIGHRIRIDMKDQNDFCEIIGIVANVKRETLDKSPLALIYWPHPELAYSSMMLAIRVDRDPLGKAAIVADIVHRIDPDLPLADVSTMEQALGESIARQHFSAVLIGIFAGIALFLAAIGIYGVIAHAVSLRTHEFGIRIALGAEKSQVRRLVLRHGLKIAAIGVPLGIVGTLALTRLIQGLLFGITAHDPATIAAVAAFLVAVTLAACWIPAHRAVRVDPIVALRYE